MYRLSLILLFFVVSASCCFSQHLNPEFAEHIIVANGLPDATITAICSDEDGFLWIGTNNGLCRYDGVEYKKYFHSKDTATIPGNLIKGVITLGNHRLLVNTGTGLCIWNTGTEKAKNLLIRSKPGMFAYDNNFTVAAVDLDGLIWAGTQTALYRLDTSLHILEQWQDYKGNVSDNVYLSYVQKLKPLNNGTMLAELNPYKGVAGYYICRPTTTELLPVKQSTDKSLFVFNRPYIRDCIFETNGNTVYIRHLTDSLFFYNSEINNISAIPLDIIKGKKEIYFNSRLLRLSKNITGITLSNGGMVVINNGNANITYDDLILGNDQVLCNYSDPTGNIWLGTTNGLYKFTKASLYMGFYNFPVNNSITHQRNELLNIFEANSKLFISTSGGGFFYNDKSTWKNTAWNDNVFTHDTWNVRHVNADSFWIATQAGVYCWCMSNDHYRIVQWPKEYQWINTLAVTTQFTDSHHLLWMGLGMGNGLLVYNMVTDSIRHYYNGSKPVFPLRYPIAIDEDEYGNVWMGGAQGTGLCCWNRRADSFSIIHPVYNTDFDNAIIFSIYADKRDDIWMATAEGLMVYNIKSNSFKKYTITDGLPSSIINSITADNNNHLWVATRNGLCCIDMLTRKITAFNGLFHFPESEIGSVYYSARIDSLYFLTGLSVCRIKPRDWLQELPTSKVFITDASAFDKSFTHQQHFMLDHDENNISIAFTAVNLTDGSNNQYFYRLDTSTGKPWIPVNHERQISFSNLAAGDYIFQVKALMSDGSWSSNIASLAFSIASPVWQKWWFILLCILFVIGLLYIIYRYRIRQLLLLQQIRNRIATDLHDDIGSTLTNISILSALSSANISAPDKASTFLERISEEVQRSSQSLDDIVWSINSVNDNFDQLAARMRRYAAEVFDASDIDYRISFDEKMGEKKISMEQRKDIYLIFKEAVNNIYKHAKATTVSITLSEEKKQFRMQVVDNGKGFDPSLPTSRNGVKNMQGRAKKWEGSININTSQHGTTLSVDMMIT